MWSVVTGFYYLQSTLEKLYHKYECGSRWSLIIQAWTRPLTVIAHNQYRMKNNLKKLTWKTWPTFHQFTNIPLLIDPLSCSLKPAFSDQETGVASESWPMLCNLTMKKARVAVNTFDDGGLRSAESVQIDIAVEDINEYPPVLQKVSYSFDLVCYSFDLVENEILSEYIIAVNEDHGTCNNVWSVNLTYSLQLPSALPFSIRQAGHLQSTIAYRLWIIILRAKGHTGSRNLLNKILQTKWLWLYFKDVLSSSFHAVNQCSVPRLCACNVEMTISISHQSPRGHHNLYSDETCQQLSTYGKLYLIHASTQPSPCILVYSLAKDADICLWSLFPQFSPLLPPCLNIFWRWIWAVLFQGFPAPL